MENIQGHEMLNLRKVYPDADRDIEPATDVGLAKNRQYRDYIQAKKASSQPVNGQTNGHTNGHANGHSNGNAAKSNSHRDDEVRKVDAIVVGAGQAGLCTAGYLKALELDTVVVERNKEIGDNWTNRYESLYLHTPHRFSEYPLERAFDTHGHTDFLFLQTILPSDLPSTTKSIASG